MNYVVGPEWRDQWDVVIVSAGKPAFYTEDNRPFREVGVETGKVKFKPVTKLAKGNVYTAGKDTVQIGFYRMYQSLFGLLFT
jgi:hypothetical protein